MTHWGVSRRAAAKSQQSGSEEFHVRIAIERGEPLREVLRRCGVAETRLEEAVAQVRQQNPGLGVDETLRAGTLLELDDACLRDGYESARAVARGWESAGAPRDAILSGGLPGAQRMGALQGFGLAAPAQPGAADLPPGAPTAGGIARGSVADLAWVRESLGSIDRATLEVSFPLREGTFALPTPSGPIPIQTAVDAHVRLRAAAREGERGLQLAGVELELDPPVVLRDLDALTQGHPLGGVLRAAGRIAPRLAIEGFTLEDNGTLKPRFGLRGPGGLALDGLGVPFPELLLPRLEVDAERLLRGELFQSTGLLPLGAGTSGRSGGQPTPEPVAQMDLAELLGAFGAITEEGTFLARVEGDGALVAMSGDGTQLQRPGGAFSFTFSGAVDASAQGLVDATLETRARGDLGTWEGSVVSQLEAADGGVRGRLQLEGRAAPGVRTSQLRLQSTPEGQVAARGGLSASIRDDVIVIEAGQKTATFLRDLAGRAFLRLDEGLDLRLQGNALVSAGLSFQIGEGHVLVTNGEVAGRVDLSGTEGGASLHGIRLREGSSVRFAADASAAYRDGQLWLRSDALELGVRDLELEKGPLRVPLENGEGEAVLRGGAEIRARAGKTEGEADLQIAGKSRPRLLGLPSPVAPRVEGQVGVRWTSVGFSVDDDLRVRVCG